LEQGINTKQNIDTSVTSSPHHKEEPHFLQ